MTHSRVSFTTVSIFQQEVLELKNMHEQREDSFKTLQNSISLKRRISVVLPAYNEEENILKSIIEANKAVTKISEDFEIIVVDDGSVDGTAAVCRKLKSSLPNLHIICHKRNRGYGAALRSGFEAATKDWIFFSDSDGQFHFDDMELLTQEMFRYDMMIGYRKHRRDPWIRKVNSAFGNALARVLFGIRCRDINCAFKLFRSDLLGKLSLQSEGALINTEILALAVKQKWSYQEVAIPHYPRVRGKQTGANPGVIFKTCLEYFELRARLKCTFDVLK